MDVFDLDSARWPELAVDRLAWQTMLRDGGAAFHAPYAAASGGADAHFSLPRPATPPRG